MNPEFEVIATRRLEATGDHFSGVRQVLVEIGMPYRDPFGDGDWKCGFRISGPDGERGMEISGTDGIQAIHGALMAVGAVVRSIHNPPHIVLTFYGQENLFLP